MIHASGINLIYGVIDRGTSNILDFIFKICLWMVKE
jgi:hypothetical protein